MDNETTNMSYLLHLSLKEVVEAIYDLATNYSLCIDVPTSHLECNSNSDKIKTISAENVRFLEDNGIINDFYYTLSDVGKAFFELYFIHNQQSEALSLIKNMLLINPLVNLIIQVFLGRGKISIEQLRTLLNYHSIADWEIDNKEVVSLLTFLNKLQIITYDKKNRAFTVNEPEIADSKPIKQYYVTPSTPFSNIINMRKIIRACEGDIYWIDKHFRKEAFEIILDGMLIQGVSSIVVISGPENATASAKTDYALLKTELLSRSIALSWLIINDPAFKWHDRWIVADNICYNIPPVLSIIRGQRADIVQSSPPTDMQLFLDSANEIS